VPFVASLNCLYILPQSKNHTITTVQVKRFHEKLLH